MWPAYYFCRQKKIEKTRRYFPLLPENRWCKTPTLKSLNPKHSPSNNKPLFLQNYHDIKNGETMKLPTTSPFSFSSFLRWISSTSMATTHLLRHYHGPLTISPTTSLTDFVINNNNGDDNDDDVGFNLLRKTPLQLQTLENLFSGNFFFEFEDN